jgi:hypothetical protein
MPLGRAFEHPFWARPSHCSLSTLHGTSDGASMTTPGGAGTTFWLACLLVPRARRTGFSHGVGAPTSGPSFCQSFMGLFPDSGLAVVCANRIEFSMDCFPENPLLNPKSLRTRSASLAVLAPNARRYGHSLAGVPGLSGWSCADFHGAVNFAFTEFSEVRLERMLRSSPCSTPECLVLLG